MTTGDSGEAIAQTLGLGRRKQRGVGWVVAVLAVVLAFGGWWLVGRTQGDAVRYETSATTRGALTVTVSATGTVQPTTQVEVSSELSGTLASVEVDYNDPVTVGQVLARLDDAKLRALTTNAEASQAAAQGQLAQAEATAREAEANYQTQAQLERRGVTTHMDFTATEAARDRARAAVEIARANLALAEANLQLQRADLEKAVIRSPIKGIVLDRAAEAGQIVASALSAPILFTLAEDLGRMELRVDIDEADIGQVRAGNNARFTVDAWPGRSFPATLSQLRYAPETTEGVVTYKAVLTVDNSEGLLRPGMTATATITVRELADALLVPNAALRFTPPQDTAEDDRSGSGLLGLILPRPPSGDGQAAPDGRTLWLLRDGLPVQIAVTTGDSDGRQTAILSGELAEGDLVITDQTTAN